MPSWFLLRNLSGPACGADRIHGTRAVHLLPPRESGALYQPVRPRRRAYRSPDGSRGEESRPEKTCQRRSGLSSVPPRDSTKRRTMSRPRL